MFEFFASSKFLFAMVIFASVSLMGPAGQGRRFTTTLADFMLITAILMMIIVSRMQIESAEDKQIVAMVPDLEKAVEEQKGLANDFKSKAKHFAFKNEQLGQELGNLQQKNTQLGKENERLGEKNQTLGQEKVQLGQQNQKWQKYAKGIKHKLFQSEQEKHGIREQQRKTAADLGQTQQHLDEQLAVNEKLKSRFLTGKPLTLLVLLDITGSMQDNIDSLLSSVKILFTFMPTTSKEFRLGILPYRNQVVSELPIMTVKPRNEDGGESQDKILAHLSKLRAKKSSTNHRAVFSRAMEMLQQEPQDSGHITRIVLLGDVGPSELDNKQGYSPEEHRAKDTLLHEMQLWADEGNRGIASFYTANQFNSNDPGAATSRRWFKQLGQVSRYSKFYTDPNDIIVATREAIFERKQNE